GALAACGYRVDRLSRSWRLNLSDRTAELLLARSSARKDMARIGIEIRSLDDTADESIWSELYGLAAETIPDIPSTFSEAIPSFRECRTPKLGGLAGRSRARLCWSAARDKGSAPLSHVLSSQRVRALRPWSINPSSRKRSKIGWPRLGSASPPM